MSLISDAGSGGGMRPPVAVPTSNPARPQSTGSGESDAAARARELQRQLDALMERIREAQRRAEEARKRAIEAQKKADEARARAEMLEAKRSKSAEQAEAADKAQRESKLEEAKAAKASAEGDLKLKEVALLRAQAAEKREQKQRPDGVASGDAQQKVKHAQAERDASKRSDHVSALKVDAVDKENKAVEAEARAGQLAPRQGPGLKPVSKDERAAFDKAQAAATQGRKAADNAKTAFTDAVGADASTAFFGAPPKKATTPAMPAPLAPLPDDPLHSPLTRLLQVSPSAGSPDLGSGLSTGSPVLLTSFMPPKAVSPDVARTLTGVADGRSVADIASDRKVSVEQVVSEAGAAGVKITSTEGSDVQVTTLRRGDATVTYTRDLQHDTVTVTGDFADPSAAGGRKTVQARQDASGHYSHTTHDAKSGETTTVSVDPDAGTRTTSVVDPHGKRVDTTVDMGAAPVRRKVGDREGYLEVAKAAGLTPEQLRVLNPDVDYGKALKPGQELVVAGVPTTVKTVNEDGTTLVETTTADGRRNAVFTDAGGDSQVLMGPPGAKDRDTEAARKGIFDEGKSVADVAKAMDLTTDQVLALLPPGTVDRRPASSETSGIETRTLFDPDTNRLVVETIDGRHDRYTRQVIDENTKFKVNQPDPKTGKPVPTEVKGGVGWLQQQADHQQANADDYSRRIADIDVDLTVRRRQGEPLGDLPAQRKVLVDARNEAQEAAGLAQGKANLGMTQRQKVVNGEQAAIAYNNHVYARPGTPDQAKADASLKDVLQLSDRIDRLIDVSQKDLDVLKAGADARQAHDTATTAQTRLDEEFLKWKDDVWMWQDVPPDRVEKMKAEGQLPPMRMFPNEKAEHDAAWDAFVQLQEDLDRFGEDRLPDSHRASRDAWQARNAASDADLAATVRFDDAALARNAANAHAQQGELDRLLEDKHAWMKVNPDRFDQKYDGQKAIDDQQQALTDTRVQGLQIGEEKQHDQFLQTVSAPDRADPEALKKAEEKYAEDHREDLAAMSHQITDLTMASMREKAKSVDDFIASSAKRDPKLKEALDAFGKDSDTRSANAAEHRADGIRELLAASPEGRDLASARDMGYALKAKFLEVGDAGDASMRKDLEGIEKGIEGHTFLRDMFDRDDASETAKDYAEASIGESDRLRQGLASGDITLSDYAAQQDALMDTYDVRAGDLAAQSQRSDERWAMADEIARTTASAVVGITATALSGGNVALGIAAGVAVNQMWDTTGDLVAAAQGRDIYADGHSSLTSLWMRARMGEKLTWDDVRFTLKDDAIDIATSAVTATGVGAGVRTAGAVSARLLAQGTLNAGGRVTLKVASEQGLNLAGRAVVGARAGITSQALDGAGRVAVETAHVGFDGKLGTAEGNQRISSTAVSSAVGLLTAPVTGAVSGSIPLQLKVPGAGLGAQFLNDAAGSLGTGQLISYANNGRGMNQDEVVAAAVQAVPGTLSNLAMHPSVVARFQRGRDAQVPPATPLPATETATPTVKPPVVEVNTRTENLAGLGGRGADRLRLIDTTLPELTQGLDTPTRAVEALAPGGTVEFHVPADSIAATPSSTLLPGEAARETRVSRTKEENAIRVRLRGVGLEDIKFNRPANPGARQPALVVTARRPAAEAPVDRPFDRPVYDGYDQRSTYLSGTEMIGLYGSGTQGRRPVRPPDVRVGLTARNRLSAGEYAPVSSPTLQSMSVGLSLRSDFKAMGASVVDSVQQRSLTPMKTTFGTEASVAVRPDEYRRTSLLQWGLMPYSRDTIFTVFARDLMGAAKRSLFTKDGVPGFDVTMRSAEVKGPAADGSGRVVEVELSPKLDGEPHTLPDGEVDFLGGKASNTPDGHVKVKSSLMFDRVIEDLRIAPLPPLVKKALGYTAAVVPSVERRSQMLLKDVVREGDVVPQRFFEQFQKTFADARYRMQVVVPEPAAGKLFDPVAQQVSEFVAAPTPERLKALVDSGAVDPDRALFFIPEKGSNHHRTSIPGKPFSETVVDLTGTSRTVPNRGTSNVWVTFADNAIERGAQRAIYRTKKAAYDALPESLQRSAPSTHHVPGRGNLIDGMMGGRGRPNADASARRTVVFVPKEPVVQTHVLTGSVEVRFQAGAEPPKQARSVAQGDTQTYRVSPESDATVEVPTWFPRLISDALHGPTPVIPKGGRAQMGKVLDSLEAQLPPAQRDRVVQLRETHMEGKSAQFKDDKTPTFSDGKFLRAPVAQAFVDVLGGLRPGADGPRTLMTGAAARRPEGLSEVHLNLLEGDVTVDGQRLSPQDIQVAAPSDSIVVMASSARPPSAADIESGLRAKGLTDGRDVVVYLCDAGVPKDASAVMPDSLAHDLSRRIGARVHAVAGSITLGERTVLGGEPVTARPNLPLASEPRGTDHRFWLEPGGRSAPADAPFGPDALNKGAWVADDPIDPLHLGIEDRVVDLHTMDADNALAVFPHIERLLGVSPEYMRLGRDGMIDKWLGEIQAGTRYAKVIYPAEGSTPASSEPIGIISVHKEALIGDNYLGTLPATLYRGSKPAGEMSKADLAALGEVWQFSTYLGPGKDRYPSGAVNKAARMQLIAEVTSNEASQGRPVDAFYSRVHAGAPFVTGSDGVTVKLKGHDFNVKSAFSQESQTGGRGPIAVGYELGSPFKTPPDFADGDPARHISVYRTPADHFAADGPGTTSWRKKIDQAFDKVPGSRSLLGGAPRLADVNLLEGNATVGGRPVAARDIQLAVPPDSVLVLASRAKPPSVAEVAAAVENGGFPKGKDVVLYFCDAATDATPGAVVPQNFARDLSNRIGARVHAVDGSVTLGEKIVLDGNPVVQRPHLPLAGEPHDAQRRFWLEPGGRQAEATAPFGPDVLAKGAWVDDAPIDPLHLGIEDRVVDLQAMDADTLLSVFPHIKKQLEVSPDYIKLGRDGWIDKWLGEIREGTRYGKVIYPAEGSTPSPRQPIGIISVHKEALVGDNYLGTLPPTLYRGSKPAGEMSKADLAALGEVWQTSTYLGVAKDRYPGGAVNKAARMQLFTEVLESEARLGRPVDAFYARVHAGAPFVTGGDGVTVALKGHEPNNGSQFSQESQTRGRGPIAVGYELGSPIKTPRDYPAGDPARHVSVYRTPAADYASDGPGMTNWRKKIDQAFDKTPGSRALLRPETLTVDHAAAQPLSVQTENGVLQAFRMMGRGEDGVLRPLEGYEVLWLMGDKPLGTGMEGDVYAFGSNQVIKVYRTGAEENISIDREVLLDDLPRGAKVDLAMAPAEREAEAMRELVAHMGPDKAIGVHGPYLVGDRLALVMPRHTASTNQFTMNTDLRLIEEPHAQRFAERSAHSAGAIVDALAAKRKWPSDPQFLVKDDGSLVVHDPGKLLTTPAAHNFFEDQSAVIARTGRQQAAGRAAGAPLDNRNVRFVVGPDPAAAREAGSVPVESVHGTVAGAKWAAIGPMPDAADPPGSPRYVYTVDRNAADAGGPIALESVIAARQVDRFGRFVADPDTGRHPWRQVPSDLLNLKSPPSERGQ